MKTTTCSWWGCENPPAAAVANATTHRLHENWQACMAHLTRTIVYLYQRDRQMKAPESKVTLQEIQPS